MIYYTKNASQTAALARRMSRALTGGELILLQGELGAGKTTFARALARALGVKEKITSPTFVLMRRHKTQNVKCKIQNLIHCDAYRIADAKALKEIGLMDWIGRPDTIVLVEWGEKIRPLLKGRDYFTIKFSHGKSANERRLVI